MAMHEIMWCGKQHHVFSVIMYRVQNTQLLSGERKFTDSIMLVMFSNKL